MFGVIGMNEMRVKSIAIIGGGTAGWLAANHLAVELRAEADVTITVIESPEIGIIGVGEGTVPHIRQSLMKFGISEADLLASCDATFKMGIKFQDWMQSTERAADNFYYHPFASPYPGGLDVNALYLEQAESLRYSEVCATAFLAEAMKSPKHAASQEYEGAVNYAYHFNAVKFGQLLARNARERFGVQHLSATLSSAVLDESGAVSHLITEDGQHLHYDFYVDCSGFHALIMGKALQVPLVDKSKQILSDVAIAVQIPYATADHKLPPYTLAKAHKAGWLWDIPLTQRRGVGFVYSSAHMSETEALDGLSSYLQTDASLYSPRKIPMRIGYREQFWVKNAVSLGLAQGFVEPLEATSIFVTDFAAELFARNFSVRKDGMSVAASYCNRVLAYTWERVMDFVQLHYCISDRRDSAFWRDCTEGAKPSDVLAERLAIWRHHAPKKSDFFSRFDLFDVDNFLFVLYGMKYPTAIKNLTDYERTCFQNELRHVDQRRRTLASQLLDHRDWLQQFNLAYQGRT